MLTFSRKVGFNLSPEEGHGCHVMSVSSVLLVVPIPEVTAEQGATWQAGRRQQYYYKYTSHHASISEVTAEQGATRQTD